MVNTKFKKDSKKKKFFVLGLAILLLVFAVIVILETRGVIHLRSNSQTTAQQNSDNASTTSEQPTAQPDFSDGDDREAGNSLNDNSGSAIVNDNNGSVGSNVDTSNPIVSSTGDIKVYTPKNNLVIKSGQELSGESTLNNVGYRIIDSLTGVIATGSIKVVNGKFAGIMSFNTGADEGRIDVYGTRADGTEFSNIEINVRFK